MLTKKNFRSKGRKPTKSTKKAKFSLPVFEKNRVWRVLPTPIKSESDKKEYKVVKLTNGLTALLISDLASLKSRNNLDEEFSSESEDSSSDGNSGASDGGGSVDNEDTRTNREIPENEEKMAACALSVNVGCFSDPLDIQGLAHFLEHMVFMGSSKYPKENDFDKFIKKKGGSDNASTDAEVTTFHFEIEEKHLAEAMDKFSQFFVHPLMHKESMQREREAVESEFAMALPSDIHRKDQLLLSTLVRGHPATKFSWGNMKSLRDLIINDDFLHTKLHKFRKRHYSAHRMMVAVQARLSLDLLEKYVGATFGSIPTNNLPPHNFTNFNYIPEILSPDFHGIFYVYPAREVTEVNLTWCMRSFLKEYQSKPDQYVSFIIGHEGKYSLLSYLHEKVWALGIFAGNTESGTDHTSMYSMFTIRLILTEIGIRNLDEVLVAVFSYLNMLRKVGPCKRLYDEMKQMADINFRFEEECQPCDNVESLAENMHTYPPEHYLCGSELYFKYDPEAIQYVMNELTADNVNIMVLSKKYDEPIEYNQREPWFGTDYNRNDVPESLKRRLRSAPIMDCFKLPEENIYVTENFDLIRPPNDDKSTPKCEYAIDDNAQTDDVVSQKYVTSGNCANKEYPILLRKDKLMELWYKPDYKFGLPNAYIYMYFISPVVTRSAKDCVILDIWCELLKQFLVEIVYPAEMASLTQSISTSEKGLIVKIYGYNEKLHHLVDSVTKAMREYQSTVTLDLFEAVKAILAKSYHNAIIKPTKLVREVRLALLLKNYWTSIHKIEALNSVEVDDIHRVGNEFLNVMYVQILIQGNMLSTDAVNIGEKIYSNVRWLPLPGHQYPDIKVNKFNTGETKCRIQSFNKNDPNTLVTNYYQSDLYTIKDCCIVEFIIMLMEEPLFDTLRTKEQLGYNVFCLLRYTFGVLGYSVTVNTQADKFSAEHVDARIEQFLKTFSKQIRKLSNKSFQQTKLSLIKLKQSADIELKEEITRNWGEITSMEYIFDRLAKEVECIKALKHSDIKKWFNSHTICGNGDNLKKLSVQIVGHPTPEDSTPTSEHSGESVASQYPLQYLTDDNHDGADGYVTDIYKFNSSLGVYPTVTKWAELCKCSD